MSCNQSTDRIFLEISIINVSKKESTPKCTCEYHFDEESLFSNLREIEKRHIGWSFVFAVLVQWNTSLASYC